MPFFRGEELAVCALMASYTKGTVEEFGEKYERTLMSTYPNNDPIRPECQCGGRECSWDWPLGRAASWVDYRGEDLGDAPGFASLYAPSFLWEKNSVSF